MNGGLPRAIPDPTPLASREPQPPCGAATLSHECLLVMSSSSAAATAVRMVEPENLERRGPVDLGG